jgi:hypothetical protein
MKFMIEINFQLNKFSFLYKSRINSKFNKTIRSEQILFSGSRGNNSWKKNYFHQVSYNQGIGSGNYIIHHNTPGP